MCTPSPSKKRRRVDLDNNKGGTTTGTPISSGGGFTTGTLTPSGKVTILDVPDCDKLAQLYDKRGSFPSRYNIADSYVRLGRFDRCKRAQFGLIIKKTGLPYLPTGKEADSFLYGEISTMIRLDGNHTFSSICALLEKKYGIDNLKDRVSAVMDVEMQRQFDARLSSVESSVAGLHSQQLQLTNQQLKLSSQQSNLLAKIEDIQQVQIGLLREIKNSPNPVYYYSKCSRVNHELRKKHPECPDRVAIQEAQRLCKYLDLSVPLCPGQAFRGLDGNNMPPFWQFANICLGATYSDKGFTSATLLPNVAVKFATEDNTSDPIILIITHHSGRYVKDFVSHEYAWEEEVLFKPEVSFKVHKVEPKSETSVFTIIHMAEN